MWWILVSIALVLKVRGQELCLGLVFPGWFQLLFPILLLLPVRHPRRVGGHLAEVLTDLSLDRSSDAHLSPALTVTDTLVASSRFSFAFRISVDQ